MNHLPRWEQVASRELSVGASFAWVSQGSRWPASQASLTESGKEWGLLSGLCTVHRIRDSRRPEPGGHCHGTELVSPCHCDQMSQPQEGWSRALWWLKELSASVTTGSLPCCCKRSCHCWAETALAGAELCSNPPSSQQAPHHQVRQAVESELQNPRPTLAAGRRGWCGEPDFNVLVFPLCSASQQPLYHFSKFKGKKYIYTSREQATIKNSAIWQ